MHHPVEPSWPHQCRIQHARSITTSQHHHPRVILKPIHLRQKLINRRYGVIPPAYRRISRLPNRIKLINEQNAGGVFPRPAEHVPHTRRAHAHKHVGELRARLGVKRHPGLVGNRLGEERFARPGGAHQEDAVGGFGPELLESLGWFQEVHQLLDFLLDVVNARDVVKGDLRLPPLHLDQLDPAKELVTLLLTAELEGQAEDHEGNVEG